MAMLSRQRSATRSPVWRAGDPRFRDWSRAAAHLSIDKIVASPLVRAQETASLVAACYSHEIQRYTSGLAPNGIPDQVIAEYDEGVGSVLLVTHMPLIAGLVAALSGKRRPCRQQNYSVLICK